MSLCQVNRVMPFGGANFFFSGSGGVTTPDSGVTAVSITGIVVIANVGPASFTAVSTLCVGSDGSVN